MPPASRITDMHTCPMVTGIVPHVGGPILPPGEPTVLIGMLPAARMTDMLTCVGPPDTILMGSPTVLIGNLMAARLGDPTAHGGVIILGEPTVEIGEVGMGSPVVVTPIPPLVLLAQAMAAAGSAAAQAVSNAAQSLAQSSQSGTAVIGPSPGSSALAQAAGAAPSAVDEVPPVVVSPDKTSWIEIELIDESGEPVPDQPYQLLLPDGSTFDGTLDDSGQARVEGIDPGTCQITFPDLDKDAWKSD